MRPVLRSQILDRARYERSRSFSQSAVMEIKRRRRVHVGSCLTFLFENTTTIWYQKIPERGGRADSCINVSS